MADDNQKTTDTALNIPEDTKTQFPELVKMTEASSSMDDKEKQYWIDVLPIMTDDQIDNLREILNNEKKQINEVNSKYNKEVEGATKKAVNQFNSEEYKEKKRIRAEAERLEEEGESSVEEDLLSALDDL